MPDFQELCGRWRTAGNRYMAEREGFEPPIRLPVCRISSAVHSTTLPPLHSIVIYHEIDHGPAISGPPGRDCCDCANVRAREFRSSLIAPREMASSRGYRNIVRPAGQPTLVHASSPIVARLVWGGSS